MAKHTLKELDKMRGFKRAHFYHNLEEAMADGNVNESLGNARLEAQKLGKKITEEGYYEKTE